MAISAALKAFLDAEKIAYEVQKHAVVYTAQEIAAAQHVPGRQLAKCVLLTTNAGPFLAVLPAIQRVDFKKLKTLLSVTRASLASEADIKKAFPDVEVGAMSVFGNLYHVPVVAEEGLSASPEIVCNAGTHSETITLRYQDFARAVRPRAGAFGMAVPGQAPKKPAKKKAGKNTGKTSSQKRPARKPPAARKPATRRKR